MVHFLQGCTLSTISVSAETVCRGTPSVPGSHSFTIKMINEANQSAPVSGLTQPPFRQQVGTRHSRQNLEDPVWATGRLVRPHRALQHPRAAGERSAGWAARGRDLCSDSAAANLPGGLYYCAMEAGGKRF